LQEAGLPNARFPDDLTTKQHQTLELLARNYTTKDVARRFGVSPSAINQRVEGMLQKFSCNSRGELIRRYQDTCSTVYSDDRQVGEDWQMPKSSNTEQFTSRAEKPGASCSCMLAKGHPDVTLPKTLPREMRARLSRFRLAGHVPWVEMTVMLLLLLHAYDLLQ
jgi:DNA-binding CsgD family transcriptional regulator